MNVDPRLEPISRRMEGVQRIVAVTGGKGGIGKSLVATTLALALAGRGRRVGLFDLDLTGPCDHLILGHEGGFPEEEFGIEPALVAGVRFMSITCFSGESPAPLRGEDVSNALIELLAITRWGELDALIIDMPPGIGDAILDALRLLRRAEYLVVSTSSRVVIETVRRTLTLLNRVDAKVLGVVGNMKRGESPAVRDLAAGCGVELLAELPFDEAVEDGFGDPEALRATRFGSAVDALAAALVLAKPR